MSVRVQPGGAWIASSPTELFRRSGELGMAMFGANGPTYDVAPDGSRFLMLKFLPNADSGATAQMSLVVIQNWPRVLNAR